MTGDDDDDALTGTAAPVADVVTAPADVSAAPMPSSDAPAAPPPAAVAPREDMVLNAVSFLKHPQV
jgi:hypothetical protein